MSGLSDSLPCWRCSWSPWVIYCLTSIELIILRGQELDLLVAAVPFLRVNIAQHLDQSGTCDSSLF